MGTYSLSIKAGSIQSIFKGYNNLPCVLYSLGAFVLLRDIAQWVQKSKRAEKVINCLGKYTFPLYLLHWFILRIREKLIVVDTKSIVYRLFAPYVIYLIVIAITWCLRKIPFVRKIVP